MKSGGARNVPIRIPERLMAKVVRAAELLDMKQQEVIRLAMEIGLEDLERIRHDPASAIVDAAARLPDTEERQRLLQSVSDRPQG